MSRMSKKLTNKLSFVLLCFILLFYSTSQSDDKIDNFKILTWIENVPILSSLIENKRDLSKKQIFSFYNNFFEEKKWKKNENENVWEIKNKVFKRKIFKIENFEDNIFRIKIIVENF